MQWTIDEVSFTDNDVINLSELFGTSFTHHKGFLFHDHGFVLGVVLAKDEDSALDCLADAGKINHLKVEYSIENETFGFLCLGNSSGFFDVETISTIEFDIPEPSLVKLF